MYEPGRGGIQKQSEAGRGRPQPGSTHPLAPSLPLTRERGGINKKTIRAVFSPIFMREGGEIIEFDCNTNK